MERQLAGFERGLKMTQEEPPVAPRQHFHRQEEAGAAGNPARAVRRGAAARDEAVDMWMMKQGLTPRVQYCDTADLGAEVLRIGGDAAQRLRRRPEQDVVDSRLVLKRDLG